MTGFGARRDVCANILLQYFIINISLKFKYLLKVQYDILFGNIYALQYSLYINYYRKAGYIGLMESFFNPLRSKILLQCPINKNYLFNSGILSI